MRAHHCPWGRGGAETHPNSEHETLDPAGCCRSCSAMYPADCGPHTNTPTAVWRTARSNEKAHESVGQQPMQDMHVEPTHAHLVKQAPGLMCRRLKGPLPRVANTRVPTITDDKNGYIDQTKKVRIANQKHMIDQPRSTPPRRNQQIKTCTDTKRTACCRRYANRHPEIAQTRRADPLPGRLPPVRVRVDASRGRVRARAVQAASPVRGVGEAVAALLVGVGVGEVAADADAAADAAHAAAARGAAALRGGRRGGVKQDVFQADVPVAHP